MDGPRERSYREPMTAARRFRGAGVVGACAIACASCEVEPAPARGQLLVVVDTDLPVAGQLRDRPDVSIVAAVDTARIEVFALDGSLIDSREVLAPEPEDWPLSFGIASADARAVRVRIRIFQAAFAERVQAEGSTSFEPEAPIAVDRTAELEMPDEGVREVLLRLAGDCIGIPSSASTTCLDAAHPSVASREAFEETAAPIPTRVGTWASALSSPCSAPDTADRVCVEGGFSFLGDHDLDGYLDGVDFQVGPSPVHPVRTSPFYMDRTEVTVQRFDGLLAAGLVVDTLPIAYPGASTNERLCNWQYGDGAMPLNCVTLVTAQQICAALGGSLPTEAQWEFAARGRGLARHYPWGDVDPSCCTTGVALEGGTSCGEPGSRAVGSFVGLGGCPELDASRDGILDMAGNVSELTLDASRSYADACWARPGLLIDPSCPPEIGEPTIVRGASFQSTLAEVDTTLRRTAQGPEPRVGFRCVYTEVAP